MLDAIQKKLPPPAKIGIIGGGQLGKMLTQEAKSMGYHVVVLDPTPQSPSSQVADEQIVAAFDDRAAIRQLADKTQVVTYEFEHIDADILSELEGEGYSIYPSGRSLRIIQNKYTQKTFLQQNNLPVPAFDRVETIQDIKNNIEKYGLPIMLKSCTGGYDGKGNFLINGLEDIELAYQTLSGGNRPLMIERYIPFTKEISIMMARGCDGRLVHYPLAENVHSKSILNTTRVPAIVDEEVKERVQDIAGGVMEAFGDIGVFCIEMFVTEDNKVYINEIAPRPHNSGHYTIEACITSQYGQQLRAITGLPLGSTKLIMPAVMVNILGSPGVQGKYSFEGVEEVLEEEGLYLHLYCKHYTQPQKKIGHITVINEDLDKAEVIANRALAKIKMKESET